MLRDIVTVGEKKYILGPYIASGLIGSVYPAWENEINDGDPAKAVKIPVLNLNEELQNRFWEEFSVLENLQQAWKSQGNPGLAPFPTFERGEMFTADNSKALALVLEYIPDKCILSRIALDIPDPWQREQLFMEAALQYAHMLKALHSAGYACPDRKTSDVRWIKDKNRLVILDWNVVTSKSEEKVKQDFYLFGSMWYQFITAKYPSSEMDVLDDEIWGHISIAARRIISQLIDGHYDDVNDVEADLARWNNESQLDAQALAYQAKEEYGRIKAIEKQLQEALESTATSVPALHLGLGNNDLRALELMDMAWQKEGNRYDQERQEYLQFARQMPQRITYYAQLAFFQGDYLQGHKSVVRAIQWMQTDNAALRLTLERWRILLAGASTASNFRVHGRSWADWLIQLDTTALIGSSVEFWDDQEKKIPTSMLEDIPLFAVFVKEISLRKSWAITNELVHADYFQSDQYRQAQEALREVERLDQEIALLDEQYAQSLRAVVLTQVERVKSKLELRVGAEASLDYDPAAIVAGYVNKELQNYIQFRLQDTRKLDDSEKKKLKSFLDRVELLRTTSDNTTTLFNFLIKLLDSGEVIKMVDGLDKLIANLMINIPFSNQYEGVLARFEAVDILAHVKPSYLQDLIGLIQSCYLRDALACVEKLIVENTLDEEKYKKLMSYLSDISAQRFQGEIR